MDRTRFEVRISDELVAQIRQAAEAVGVTPSQAARMALRLFTAALLDRLAEAEACPMCDRPRRPDPLEDAMAHAQCDQIIANLGRQLAHG